MNVLGIDTGTATLGWAIFSTTARKYSRIGALELGRDVAKKKTDDHADRIARVAETLTDLMIGADIVVVERMSFPPGGTVPIALGFGAVIGAARATVLPPAVYTVSPQDWQRAVLPKSGRRVDYSALERVIGQYVRGDKDAAISLDSLPVRSRTHAIDACAISLMGAFRLGGCRLVGSRQTVAIRASNATDHISPRRRSLAPGYRNDPPH